jgi:hypothetical protein
MMFLLLINMQSIASTERTHPQKRKRERNILFFIMTAASTSQTWLSYLQSKTQERKVTRSTRSTKSSHSDWHKQLLTQIEKEQNLIRQWNGGQCVRKTRSAQPPKKEQKTSFDNLEKLVKSIRASANDAYQKFLDALPGVSSGLLLLSGEVPENLKQCPGDGVEQPQLLRICSHLMSSLEKKSFKEEDDVSFWFIGRHVVQPTTHSIDEVLESKNMEAQRLLLELDSKWPLAYAKPLGGYDSDSRKLLESKNKEKEEEETATNPTETAETNQKSRSRGHRSHKDKNNGGDTKPKSNNAKSKRGSQETPLPDSRKNKNNGGDPNDGNTSPRGAEMTSQRAARDRKCKQKTAKAETNENRSSGSHLSRKNKNNGGHANEGNTSPREMKASHEDTNQGAKRRTSPRGATGRKRKATQQPTQENHATAKKRASKTPPTITLGTIEYPTSEWDYCLTQLHCQHISDVLGREVSRNRDWAYYPCDCEKCMQAKPGEGEYLTFSSTTLGEDMFKLYRLKDIYEADVPYFPGSHPVITDNTSQATNCGKFREHRKKMNKELPLCCVTNKTESTLAFIAKHVLKWNDIGIEKVSDGTLGGKLAHHYEDRGLQFLRKLGRDWERLPTKSEIGLRNALASLAKADFLVGELTKIIQQEEDIEPCRLLLEYPMWVIMWLQSAAKVIQYMYKLDSHLYEGKEITKILRSVAENWKKAVREYKEFEGELRQATTLLPDEIQQGVRYFKEPCTNLPDADFYTLPPCYERHLFSNYNFEDEENDGNSHLFQRIRQYSPGDDGKVHLFCTCRYCRDWDGKKQVTPVEIEIPKIAKQWREANKTNACLVLLDEKGLVSWQFPIITASLDVLKNVPTLLRSHCKRPKEVDTTGGDIPVCFVDRKEHLKAFVVGHLKVVKEEMHLMDQKKSLQEFLYSDCHKKSVEQARQTAIEEKKHGGKKWRIAVDSHSQRYIEDLRKRSELITIGHLLEKVDLKSIQELKESMQQIMGPLNENLQKVFESLPEKSYFSNKN